MSTREHIRALVVEDDPDDAYFLRRKLVNSGNVRVDIVVADRLSEAFKHLDSESFDVVVSDLGLPDSKGFETFSRIHDRYPDLPLILLTGDGDENLALTAVQRGAQDYLVKGKVDGDLLLRSIRYSIERQKLISQLEKSLKEIKTLKGLIPICAWCRRLRDDKGYWKMVETYIEEQTEATFTHGICPECLKKTDPALFKEMEKERRREIGEGSE